ncbi:MAG: hypothetical protein FWH40_02450 [Coriobacteriia bacterium]|nr:hypothetical protein [Coriobacteriia bacterium]
MDTDAGWHRQLYDAIPKDPSLCPGLSEDEYRNALVQLSRFLDRLSLPFYHHTQVQFVSTEAATGLSGLLECPAVGLSDEQNEQLGLDRHNLPNGLVLSSAADPVSVAKASFLAELARLFATSLGLACYCQQDSPPKPNDCSAVTSEASLRDLSAAFAWQVLFANSPNAGKQGQGAAINSHNMRPKPFVELLLEPSIYPSIPYDLIRTIESSEAVPNTTSSQAWRYDINLDRGLVAIALPQEPATPQPNRPEIETSRQAARLWLAFYVCGYQPEIGINLENGRLQWVLQIRTAELF